MEDNFIGENQDRTTLSTSTTPLIRGRHVGRTNPGVFLCARISEHDFRHAGRAEVLHYSDLQNQLRIDMQSSGVDTQAKSPLSPRSIKSGLLEVLHSHSKRAGQKQVSVEKPLSRYKFNHEAPMSPLALPLLLGYLHLPRFST